MREAVIVRVTGSIGLTEEVVRTVIAATLVDGLLAAGAEIARQAGERKKWYVLSRAEVLGPCYIADESLPPVPVKEQARDHSA